MYIINIIHLVPQQILGDGHKLLEVSMQSAKLAWRLGLAVSCFSYLAAMTVVFPVLVVLWYGAAFQGVEFIGEYRLVAIYICICAALGLFGYLVGFGALEKLRFVPVREWLTLAFWIGCSLLFAAAFMAPTMFETALVSVIPSTLVFARVWKRVSVLPHDGFTVRPHLSSKVVVLQVRKTPKTAQEAA